MNPTTQQAGPPAGASYGQQPTPAPALDYAAPSSIPGVMVSTGENKAPMLALCAREKIGKSTVTITSLIDWPEPGKQPLVLAFDPTGPDACLKLGYRPHKMVMKDLPGASIVDKFRHGLGTLAAQGPRLHERYGSIVIDCASTAADALHEAAKQLPKNARNPDMRAPYFELGVWFRELTNRVCDLGLPSVWLSWLMEGSFNDVKDQVGPPGAPKQSRLELGGPDIMGAKLRNFIAGRAQHVFALEKLKVGQGAEGADADGFKRVIHTRVWNNINCSGRYEHLLPEPAPAHLGWILSQITGRGPFAGGAR